MKGGFIVKELTEAEVTVFNNVSQAINVSVKLGDILQNMIKEQIIPDSKVVIEDQTPVSSDNTTHEV